MLDPYGAVKNIVALFGQGVALVLLVVLYDSLHAFLHLTNDRRVAPLYKFDLPNQRFGVSLIPGWGKVAPKVTDEVAP